MPSYWIRQAQDADASNPDTLNERKTKDNEREKRTEKQQNKKKKTKRKTGSKPKETS